MANIDVYVPNHYEQAVTAKLQTTFDQRFQGHSVRVIPEDSVENFEVFIYASQGLPVPFLLTISGAIESVVQSAQFRLEVSTNLIKKPLQFEGGTWRM